MPRAECPLLSALGLQLRITEAHAAVDPDELPQGESEGSPHEVLNKAASA